MVILFGRTLQMKENVTSTADQSHTLIKEVRGTFSKVPQSIVDSPKSLKLYCMYQM